MTTITIERALIQTSKNGKRYVEFKTAAAPVKGDVLTYERKGLFAGKHENWVVTGLGQEFTDSFDNEVVRAYIEQKI